MAMWTLIALTLVTSIAAAPTNDDIAEVLVCLEIPCDFNPCPDAQDCEFGVVRDLCGCCDTCAKGPGDQCGGLFKHAGTCRSDLNCTPHPKYNQLPGRCEFVV